MSAHSGIHGMVKASTASGGSVLEVVGLNSWTADRTRTKYDTTPFQATNIQQVLGFPNAQGAIGGFWRDDDTQLWAGADSDDGVDLELYPDTANNPTIFASGPAWLDVSINTPAQGAIATSGNWVANGDFDFSLL